MWDAALTRLAYIGESPHKERNVTVSELIAHLQILPAEMVVLVDGYEDGYDAAQPPRVVDAFGPEAEDSDVAAYWGEYATADRSTPHTEGMAHVRAVFLSSSDE